MAFLKIKVFRTSVIRLKKIVWRIIKYLKSHEKNDIKNLCNFLIGHLVSANCCHNL